MYEIAAREVLGPELYLTKIAAPSVAERAQSGQFVVLRIDERGERAPFFIAGADPVEGTISVVYRVTSRTTLKLSRLIGGDLLANCLGPLGRPSEVKGYGTVVVVTESPWAGAAHFQAGALRAAGNNLLAVIGETESCPAFWQERWQEACSDAYFVPAGPDVLKALDRLLECRPLDLVVVRASNTLMRSVCEATKDRGVRTIAAPNVPMLDGFGKCGACRVKVGDQTRYACTDGPDFDGHALDWEQVINRERWYADEYLRALTVDYCDICDFKDECPKEGS